MITLNDVEKSAIICTNSSCSFIEESETGGGKACDCSIHIGGGGGGKDRGNRDDSPISNSWFSSGTWLEQFYGKGVRGRTGWIDAAGRTPYANWKRGSGGGGEGGGNNSGSDLPEFTTSDPFLAIGNGARVGNNLISQSLALIKMTPTGSQLIKDIEAAGFTVNADMFTFTSRDIMRKILRISRPNTDILPIGLFAPANGLNSKWLINQTEPQLIYSPRIFIAKDFFKLGKTYPRKSGNDVLGLIDVIAHELGHLLVFTQWFNNPISHRGPLNNTEFKANWIMDAIRREIFEFIIKTIRLH